MCDHFPPYRKLQNDLPSHWTAWGNRIGPHGNNIKRQGCGQQSLCLTRETTFKKASLWGFLLGWFQTTGQLFPTQMLKPEEGGDQRVIVKG